MSSCHRYVITTWLTPDLPSQIEEAFAFKESIRWFPVISTQYAMLEELHGNFNAPNYSVTYRVNAHRWQIYEARLRCRLDDRIYILLDLKVIRVKGKKAWVIPYLANKIYGRMIYCWSDFTIYRGRKCTSHFIFSTDRASYPSVVGVSFRQRIAMQPSHLQFLIQWICAAS